MIDVLALFREQVALGASDLHLKVGRPPIFRVAGEMRTTSTTALTTEDMEVGLKQILGEDGYARLNRENELDFAHMVPNLARFRINAFRHLGQLGMAARAIPLKPPTLEKYNLPPVLRDILAAPHGLILVTGPTGSGKSTTLACLIELLNQTEALHVVTIEDPVEFIYTDNRCTIRQRQIGTDVADFQEALKRVLRQDPDVILIGEMRDPETIRMAMTAAETGHLVLSTLHTSDAKQTIDRIIEIFPPDARDHVRSMLALTLHAVISQRLVRRTDGIRRVGALEILINTPHVRDLIQQNKIREIEAAMRSGASYKMQTFNQALCRLVQENAVNEDEAMKASGNPNELQAMIRGIMSGSAVSAPGARATPSSPVPAKGDTGVREAPQAPATDTQKLKIMRGY